MLQDSILTTDEQSSIFELIGIEYDDFKYYLKYGDDNEVGKVPQYPTIEVNSRRMGFFSSLAEAERGIKNILRI